MDKEIKVSEVKETDVNTDSSTGEQKKADAIPYARFKEINDAKKVLEDELKALKTIEADKVKVNKAKEDKEAEDKKTESEKIKEQLTEIQKSHKETLTKQETKIIKTLVKAEAQKAELNDVNDAQRFLDFSKLKYDEETDTLEGLSEALGALKEAKPYLFKATNKVNTVNPTNTLDTKDSNTLNTDLYNKFAQGSTSAFDTLINQQVAKLFKK